MCENNLNSKNPHDYCLFLILIMQTNFLLQDNAIFHRQQSVTELLDFQELNYILTFIRMTYFFSIMRHIQNIKSN